MTSKIISFATKDGFHKLYLRHEGRDYFLFSQSYRASVKAYYAKGVTLDKALNNPCAGINAALRRTMEKLPAYIRYVEKEYDIVVLDQTKKKLSAPKKRKRADDHEAEEYDYAV